VKGIEGPEKGTVSLPHKLGYHYGMILLDFNFKPRAAFAQGFLKGLGAPVVLFGRFAAPQLPVVPQVVPPGRSSSIAGDWSNIGNDIRNATSRYGKEVSTTK
jgi:hypothetical protein